MMNALRTRAAPRLFAQARTPLSTSTNALPPLKKSSTAKDWFSDSATYPLLSIMGFAAAFCGGSLVYIFATKKEVTFDPKKRLSIMQTWGKEDTPSVVEWGCKPYVRGPEGLGVDHSNYVKERAEYYKKE